ncbi:S1C family serine protease [Aldersonia sp. NBC_00410]|uniref:S1C family serine protease n=1 Tax=Aldersonia sp. NBC_00410 TaxID=2975954 RepID=UPI00225A9A69|nr:trypsin-like peptidase domain-containing protein [Aldersonia sp. NBC_00410]MCX5041839.1 S1C family serine protease [Aldersonia sp. NBC_00410]
MVRGERAPSGLPRARRRGIGVVPVLFAILAVFVVLGGFEQCSGPWSFGTQAVQTVPAPPPPPSPPPLDPVAVRGIADPVLANIDVSIEPLGLRGAGTGIVLTPDGQILTSHHVVKGASSIAVTDIGTGETFDAEVLGYDATRDIALLQLDGAAQLPVARVGDSAGVRVGNEVMAIGNAGGDGGEPTGALGVVTDLDRSIIARNEADYSRKSLDGLIEIEADVSAGQSGGSLVDWSGSVVGVVTAASGELTRELAQPTNGYAVPIADAMGVVDQIRSGRTSDTVHVGRTAELGALISNVPGGAKVDVALYGSAAYRAGIPDGAVITAANGRPVGSTEDLRAVITRAQPGEMLDLGWIDSGGALRRTVLELDEGPPN